MTHPRVVIVGAGVIGCASAYYLATAGVPVTLIDRDDVGSGTSSRCDGNVLAIDKDPGFDSQMARVSQELLHDLAQKLPPFEYRRPGSYLVCDSDEELIPAKEWVDAQRAQGLPFRYLDRDAIHSHLPDLADDIPGGLYCGSDSTLNPLLYTQRLAQAARAAGAQVLPNRPVESVTTHSGRVTGVRLADGQVIEAEVVVAALGVWTGGLTEPLGIPVPIKPRKGQLLVVAKGPLFGNAKVMEFGYLMSKFGRTRKAPPDAVKYGVALVYEPTSSHNFLLGSSREFGTWDTTPAAGVDQAIARRALRFYPHMKTASVIRSYAGLRPWTPDHFPIVSRVEPMEGLLVAAGHEGDGIGLAAVTGRLVCDLVLERTPPIDPSPLAWNRFSEEVAAHG